MIFVLNWWRKLLKHEKTIKKHKTKFFLSIGNSVIRNYYYSFIKLSGRLLVTIVFDNVRICSILLIEVFRLIVIQLLCGILHMIREQNAFKIRVFVSILNFKFIIHGRCHLLCAATLQLSQIHFIHFIANFISPFLVDFLQYYFRVYLISWSLFMVSSASFFSLAISFSYYFRFFRLSVIILFLNNLHITL